MVLPCFGCFGSEAEEPTILENGLDVVFAISESAPLCPNARVLLELYDHKAQWLSRFEAAPGSGKGGGAARWATGSLPRGSYKVVATVWHCDGVSTPMPAVRVDVGEDQKASLITLVPTVRDNHFAVAWVGVCSILNGSARLELVPGAVPHLRNVSQSQYTACPNSRGNAWDVEYFVDGAWGSHGIHEALTWSGDTPTIEPGQEIALKRVAPTIVRKGSPSVSAAPRRLKVTLEPLSGSQAVSTEVSGEELQRALLRRVPSAVAGKRVPGPRTWETRRMLIEALERAWRRPSRRVFCGTGRRGSFLGRPGRPAESEDVPPRRRRQPRVDGRVPRRARRRSRRCGIRRLWRRWSSRRRSPCSGSYRIPRPTR